MASSAARAVVASALLVGCGHDWDPFDPRLSAEAGAGGAAGSATTSVGAAGGQGGGSSASGGTGGTATGGAGGTGVGGGAGGGAPTGCNKMSILGDDFADGSIDWRWEVFEDLGNVTEGGGTLSVSMPDAPAADTWGLLRGVRMHDLADSEVSVRVVGADFSSASEGAWFSVDHVSETWLEFVLYDGELFARKNLAGDLVTVGSVAYDPSTHVVWRIRESAGTVFFETSQDGASFTALGSVATVDTFPLDLCTTEVGAWKDSGSAGAKTIVFDDFNGGASVGAYCPISDLQDDFGDGVRDRIWSRGGDYGGATIDEVGGELVITPPPQPDDGYGYYLTATSFDMSAGGAIVVEIVSTPDQSTSAEMVMGFQDLSGGDSIEALLSAGGLLFRRWEDDQWMPPFAFVSYDVDAHRFWRLRESGGEVLCETSPDRQSWTLHGQTPAFFSLSAVDVYLSAGTYEPQPAPGAGAFDDFNMP